MAKMWAGRTSGTTDKTADDFNSSIRFDGRMYAQDIQGSISHAVMLGSTGIITQQEAGETISGLRGILADIESGALAIDPSAEDIHMFVEQVLTERIGASGKKLHTARSRNDQVALDTRLYLRKAVDDIIAALRELVSELAGKAEENLSVIMPGYTHMQHAQPVLFSHHMLAYAMMFMRDISRLEDCRKRINISPIGSCALAGTTYPTDRYLEAEELGFDDICLNSLDGVSDRDFCVEFLSCASLIMLHLSRISEEIIIWNGSEFGFVELPDEFTTGSSIMPQKKNPDMAELCRGKTGRVYGDLVSLLTVLKGLPLAYNKDMQEDKEPLFDAVDTLSMCLAVFTPMLAGMKVNSARMLAAAKTGFMNATDLADYLVGKGMPFRDAYKLSGKAVALCIEKGCCLEELPLGDYKKLTPLADEGLYSAIDLAACVNRRTSAGGTSEISVKKQLEYIRTFLGK